MAAPDAMHRTDADCADRGDGRRRPVRDFTGRLAQRQRHHALSDRVAERRDARRARLVDQQSVRARFHEALLPPPYAGLGFARGAHDLVRSDALSGQQHDLRTPYVLLWTIPICHYLSQTDVIGGAEADGDPGAHAVDSHDARSTGNLGSASELWVLPHFACCLALYLADQSQRRWIHVHGGPPRAVSLAIHRTGRTQD